MLRYFLVARKHNLSPQVLKLIFSWCSLVLWGGRLILPVPCVSYEVMVKTPYLWQKEIYQHLNCLGFGFGVVLGFLQALVLIWTCLRQKTQLIMAFLCKTPQNQHCSHQKAAVTSSDCLLDQPSHPWPLLIRADTAPLSPGMEPVWEALSTSDISLALPAAALLKAFSFRQKSPFICRLLWSRVGEQPSF